MGNRPQGASRFPTQAATRFPTQEIIPIWLRLSCVAKVFAWGNASQVRLISRNSPKRTVYNARGETAHHLSYTIREVQNVIRWPCNAVFSWFLVSINLDRKAGSSLSFFLFLIKIENQLPAWVFLTRIKSLSGAQTKIVLTCKLKHRKLEVCDSSKNFVFSKNISPRNFFFQIWKKKLCFVSSLRARLTSFWYLKHLFMTFQQSLSSFEKSFTEQVLSI